MTSCQMIMELPVQPFSSISCGYRLMGVWYIKPLPVNDLCCFGFFDLIQLFIYTKIHLQELLKKRPFLRF